MSTRDYSDAHEKSVCKEMDGRQVANSGGTRFGKGDVVNDIAIFECKTVMKVQEAVRVERKWMPKLTEEKFATGKQVAAVVINFGPQTENLYIVDATTMKKLLAAYRDSL